MDTMTIFERLLITGKVGLSSLAVVNFSEL
jgi:hypothetical protein